MLPEKKRSKAAIQLIKDINDYYTKLGALVFMFDQFDGFVIMDGAPKRAEELVDVAVKHPQFFKSLQNMVKGGDVAALIGGYASVAFVIAQHHNVVPPLDQIPALLASTFGRKPKPPKSVTDFPPLYPNEAALKEQAFYDELHKQDATSIDPRAAILEDANEYANGVYPDDDPRSSIRRA